MKNKSSTEPVPEEKRINMPEDKYTKYDQIAKDWMNGKSEPWRKEALKWMTDFEKQETDQETKEEIIKDRT